MAGLRSAKPTIMIVDDDPGVRGVLCEVARRQLHANTLEAADGNQAVSLFFELKPDVVVTDVQMPGMDGVSLLKCVKDRDPTVPVILITGYPSLEVAIRGMKEGASDFLTKPFRLNQVQVVVEKALRERRLLLENRGLKEEIRQKRAIERLNEELNRKVEELSALYAYGERISTFPLHQETLLDSLVDAAQQVVKAENITVLIPEGSGSRYRVMCRSKDGTGRLMEGSVRLEPGGVLERAARRKAPVLTSRNEKLEYVATGGYPSLGEANSEMAVPLLIKGGVFGLVHASGKINGKGFDDQDLLFLTELAKRASLGLENNYLYGSVFDVLISTLRSLVSTIEARDPYTNQHSQRVTDFSVMLAQAMHCTAEEIDTVRVAGYLHDLGKLGVRDSILLKADRLTPEEFEQIKAHPVIGEAIIAPLGFLPEERSLIRHHHERWDGSGYPDGLQGDQIPFLARILSVADAFDAMTSDRPYRCGMSFREGYEEIRRCSGSQFDPRVVDAFCSVFPQWVESRSKSLAGDRAPAARGLEDILRPLTEGVQG